MMYVPPPTFELKTFDLQGMQDRIVADILGAYGGDTEIAVVTGGARGAGRNAMIAKVQAANLRDPFFIDDPTWSTIQGALKRFFSARDFVAREIGDKILAGVHRHVAAQQNRSGSAFKPLTPAYAAAKRRKFGFVVPILRATGDLLGGLLVQVTSAGQGDRG